MTKGDAPHNAGQSIEVENVISGPVSDIDFGTITVTENWGRLFIKKNATEIVVERNAYPALRDAIDHFIAKEQIASTWPVHGYAPGRYLCICGDCQTRFEGAKRSSTCPDCVIQKLLAPPSAVDPARERRQKARDALQAAQEKVLEAMRLMHD